MNCEKAMELLLEGRSGEGTELKAHLAKCQSCASNERFLHALGKAQRKVCEPSPELDLKVLAFASANAQAIQRRRLFRKVFTGIAAAAALVAVCFSATLLLPEAKPVSSGISWESVALTEGLWKLSSEIDACSATLSFGRGEQFNLTEGADSSLQVMLVDVPDFAT